MPFSGLLHLQFSFGGLSNHVLQWEGWVWGLSIDFELLVKVFSVPEPV